MGFRGKALPPTHPAFVSVAHLGPCEIHSTAWHGRVQRGQGELHGDPLCLSPPLLCPCFLGPSPSPTGSPSCLHWVAQARATACCHPLPSPPLLSLEESGPHLWGTKGAAPSNLTLPNHPHLIRRTVNSKLRGKERRDQLLSGFYVPTRPPQSLNVFPWGQPGPSPGDVAPIQPAQFPSRRGPPGFSLPAPVLTWVLASPLITTVTASMERGEREAT